MQEIINEANAQDLTDHNYDTFLHQGCISIPEAAKALWLHREAVRRMLERHTIGHRHGTTHTAPIYLTLEELAIAYPGNIRQRAPRKGSIRWTAWSRQDRLREHIIGPTDPERDESVRRQQRDRS